MKNRKYFLHCAVVAAAMLSFTACSADESVTGNIPEVITPVAKGHPLTITAAINTGAKTRLVSSEHTNGIKFSWDVADKLYLLTSADGTNWDETFYTFAAKELGTDASEATFVCEDFVFPIGTTKVKFVYTTANVAAKTDLEKTAQTLSEQSGKMEDVAKYIHMETETLDATSEDAVKELSATLAHSNAVMKVVIKKSDIEWGDGFAPAEIILKLESGSITLNGTTANTVTIKNTAAWDADDQLVVNVVVCTTGTVTTGDRWVFTTHDALGNSLVKATASAKVLAGGKRYQAPITFTTENYFPLLNSYFNAHIWDPNNQSSIAYFDEANRNFTTDPYGFAGWSTEAGGYPTTWNMSKYNYLVVKFATGSQHIAAGANFRLFDEASYWANAARTACDKDQIVIDLSQPIDKWKSDTETEETLDISRIAIVGFWSFGPDGDTERPIIIDKIYLTNEAPGEVTPPVGDGNTNISVGDMEDTDEEAF